MFTGLIQEIGTVIRLTNSNAGVNWAIRASMLARELKRGDSICISGACQTVEAVNGGTFTGTAIPETLKKTNYGSWSVGTRVNLEPPLRPTDRLDGHFVSGHVDTVGTVASVQRDNGAYEVTVAFDPQYQIWTIDQGSIAIDGVSLTIARRAPDTLTVALIPETLANTTLRDAAHGTAVNLEFDQLIKAAVQAVSAIAPSRRVITEESLTNAGWM